MAILDTIANHIWARIKPEIDEWRTEAMTTLSEALPEMASKIAEQAILTVFENTQIDEAANAVSGTITDIISKIRLPFQ